MDRCINCMEIIQSGNICQNCGYDNTNTEPEKMRYLMPGTVLKDRFLIGITKKSTNIFVTYIAYDKEKDIKVYIDEFLPVSLVKRALGKLNVETDEGIDEAKFSKSKKLLIEQTKTILGLSCDGLDILGAFEDNNTFYIIREYLEDMTLTQFIKKHNEISTEYARHIAVSLIKIMDPLHKEDIICGNIRPDNIVIDPIGCVKLTNFGFYGGLSEIISVPVNEGYSPIEQYSKNGLLTPKTDVYSIAAVYYAILSRNKPVSAKIRRKSDTLVPLSTIGIPVKKNVENAVLNALNINPANRTKDVKAFYNELKNRETVRRWERVKNKNKRDYSFIKDKVFWIRVAVCAVIIIMLISLAGVINESISVKHKVEEDKTRETEISTMAIPDTTSSDE